MTCPLTSGAGRSGELAARAASRSSKPPTGSPAASRVSSTGLAAASSVARAASVPDVMSARAPLSRAM